LLLLCTIDQFANYADVNVAIKQQM
jgi:hypothetical protein